MSLDDFIEEGIVDEDRLSFISEDPSIISPSDMKLFFSCPYAYHLKRNIGFSKIPRTAFFSMAMFFANSRRSLFRVRDPKIGRIFPYQTRAGPELKLAEEMGPEELKRYLMTDENTFGNLVSGRWLFATKTGVYAGSPLVWSFKSQGFISSKDLKTAAENYYRFVLENGAPISGFIDKEVVYEFEGHKIKIKFPEIRPGMTIDDPTLWNFNSDSPDEESNLLKSILVTMRVLGYATSIANYNFYRMKWRVPDEVFDTLTNEQRADPTAIMPTVRYRHLNALKGVVTETRRDEKDLQLLRKGIERFLAGTGNEKFTPNHDSCGICQYNCVDSYGDVVCNKRKPGSKPQVPGYYFKKKSFEIEESENNGKMTLKGSVKKNEVVKKPVGTLVFLLNETDDKLEVDTQYFSEIRGIGFEESFLKYADKRLKQLKKERKINLRAIVHFERDFKFAGQRKISEVLLKMDYTTPDNGKTYERRY